MLLVIFSRGHMIAQPMPNGSRPPKSQIENLLSGLREKDELVFFFKPPHC